MKKEFRYKRIPKMIGIVLSAALIFTSVNTSVFAQSVQSAPQKITAFATLSADIAVQNINVGDPESKIKRPTTLNVALEKTALPEQTQAPQTSESTTAASVQPAVEPVVETPAEAPAEAPATQAPQASSQETVEEAQETVTETPVETPAEAPAEIPTETQEQVSEAASEENASGEGSSVIGDQGKSLIDYLLPSIKVYAAAPAGAKTTDVINGITWRIDPKLSSAAVFSSAQAGAKFVYVPVIPATYSVPATVVLPQIVVNVTAKPETTPAPTPAPTPTPANVTPTQDTQTKATTEVKDNKEQKVEEKKENKAEEKKSEAKAEEKTEEKKSEVKPEEKTEEKKSEVKVEEKTEEKKSEAKVEDKTEEKKSEAKVEEKTEDKKTEDKKAEEKPEDKTEDKAVEKEDKTDEKTSEVISEDKDGKSNSKEDEAKTDKDKKTEDEKKDLTKETEDDKDKDKEEAFSFNETISGYDVSISAPAGVFPKGTTVSVKVVSNPRDLIEGKLSEKRNIEEIVTFSISFIYEGKEIEPKDGKVDVSIVLADDMKETLKNDSAKLQVFHIEDTDSVEEVNCSTDGEEVKFSADSFSEYTLVTTTEATKTMLDTPDNVHWINEAVLTVAWDAVKNADEYGVLVSIEGETGEIITYTTKPQIDLVEIVKGQERYYQKNFSGRNINVKIRADIDDSNKQKASMYSSSDYSGMVSKTYLNEVVIDPKNATRIVQTDAIYEALKQGLSSEQAAAAAGKELVFEITMTDLSGMGDEAGALNKYAVGKSYGICKVWDISVVAKANNVSIGFVTKTPTEVPLSIDIPLAVRKAGRTFIILRNHAGTIAEVGRTTENKVTIKTNQFSAYAIAYVDPKKQEESNENNESNNNNNQSSDNGEAERIRAMIEAHTWRPTTPDEKWRASFVGRETYKPYVDVTSGYTLHIKNAMQGPKCFAAFSVALDGYTIARTFDVLPNGYKIRNIEKEATFTVTIPWSLQKAGRDFRLICVTTNGQPVILKDLDLVPGTITVKTSKFYAFALVYKDTLPAGK